MEGLLPLVLLLRPALPKHLICFDLFLFLQKKRGSSVSFLRRRKNLPAGRVRVAEDAGPVTVDDLRLLAVAEDTSIGWLYFWTDRRRSRCGRQRVQMKQEAQECLAETSNRGRRVKLS
ncbi:hypothetical protein BHE74_00007725 [Ensete ventricosum]|nr:hypothetical protein GW17_00013990 [Ensete ventricosum]RWW83751.1 hypothetical protein BHE74_00007725 [Ensete ventricosum]